MSLPWDVIREVVRAIGTYNRAFTKASMTCRSVSSLCSTLRVRSQARWLAGRIARHWLSKARALAMMRKHGYQNLYLSAVMHIILHDVPNPESCPSEWLRGQTTIPKLFDVVSRLYLRVDADDSVGPTTVTIHLFDKDVSYQASKVKDVVIFDLPYCLHHHRTHWSVNVSTPYPIREISPVGYMIDLRKEDDDGVSFGWGYDEGFVLSRRGKMKEERARLKRIKK